MFEFDIKKIKNELVDLSYAEKFKTIEKLIKELEKLPDKINDAIDALIHLKIAEAGKHSRDVRHGVFQHVRMLIENGQLQQDKINFNADGQNIIVSSIDGDVSVTLTFLSHNQLWSIQIVPLFFARPKENQLWRNNLAEKLNRPLEFGNRDIRFTVEEEMLKDSVCEVIVKLCDA